MRRILKTRLLAAMALTLATQAALAEEFDINISDESVRGVLSGPLSRLLSGVTGQYDTGLIYKKGDHGSGDAKDSDLTLAHLGVLATGDAGAKGTKAAAGLGARLIYADRGSTDGGALALGGQFDVRMPGFERLGLSGYGYFAPGILSFSEVKNYSEYAADVDFEVVHAASIYGGYRRVNLKSEHGGSRNADDAAHIGLKLRF